MRCRNCGQEISVWGKECPWCKTPTNESAYVNVSSWSNMALGMIVGGVLAGVYGWNKSNVEDEQLAFAILYAIGGAMIGGAIGAIGGWNKADKEMTDQHDGGRGSGCPKCGFDPGYDISKHPDRYCSRCGKRFGG